MTEQRTSTAAGTACTYNNLSNLSEDQTIMRKIRKIVSRGNNAEIKQKKDGSLTVMEVKKNIV